MQEECSELRLRMETVTKSMKTVELDSKASRYVVLHAFIYWNSVHAYVQELYSDNNNVTSISSNTKGCTVGTHDISIYFCV